MYRFTYLNIIGYQGEPVPNTFLRQDQETRHLGIILPGYGYTAQMPVLYYPSLLLLARGADVLRVEYAYSRNPRFSAVPEEERNRWLAADVMAAWEAVSAERPYERFTLVGKSIGTLAMGHLLTTVERLREADCLWLTPLLRSNTLRYQIRQGKGRAFFAIGSADSHYDPKLLAAMVEATQGQSLVIEGGDHSLEIEGDVLRSVQALEQLVQRIDAFL